MFSFEGDFKKSRNISLGGSTKARVDKQQLLRKAQQERQARELERLRLRSAVLIQSFYRGRKTAQSLRAAERSAWDEAFQVVAAGGAAVDARVVERLMLLVGGLGACLKVGDGGTRLWGSFALFCFLAHLGVPLLLLPLTIEDGYWKYSMLKFLGICLRSLRANDGMSASGDEVSNVFKVVRMAMESDAYVSVEGVDGRNLCQEIVTRLVEKGLYKSLRNFLTGYSVEHKNLKSISAAVELSTRPLHLSYHSAPGMPLRQLVMQILTIPTFPNRVSINSLAQFSQRLPFDDVLQLLATDEDLMSAVGEQLQVAGVDTYAALLGNVLAFGKMKIAHMSPSLLAVYATVLQKLLNNLPERFFKVSPHTTGLAPSPEEDEEDEDDNGLQPMDIPEPSPVDERLQKWLAVLVEPTHLSKIIQSLTIPPAVAGGAHPAQIVCNFLASLMTRWSAKKTEIINALLFKSDVSILRVLWVALADWRKGALRQVQASFVTDPSNSVEWPIAVILAELFSRQLLTMGDDEFFGGKSALSLEDIVELSRAMKNVTFTLYWNQMGDGDAVVTDHWLMTSEIDMDAFVQCVVAETDGGALSPQQLRAVGPRQAILNNIPFVVPFETRVEIFREWVHLDRSRNGLDDEWLRPMARVTIRRQFVFEDGYTHLNALGSQLKNRIQITFVSEQGLVEAGIDGGGVFKEFLTALCRQAFDMNYGLFQSTSENQLFPSPQSYAAQDTQLQYLEFLGRILGKALYEGILVDAAFASFFLAKWLGRQSYLDDLPSLDPELYQGLIFLKNYKGDVERDLSLTFSVDDSGKTVFPIILSQERE
ncbi:hypothetical protein HK104_004200 [Borealophlyctis nickersoniae]|nr:hypothetical protein HK104_004200 [Borealophlyctis nickersoniae]